VEEAALQENNQQLDYGTMGLIVFKTSTHIMLAIFLLLVLEQHTAVKSIFFPRTIINPIYVQRPQLFVPLQH